MSHSSYQKFIIEVRDSEGKLDPSSEEVKRKEHPYLFHKSTFTIDELYYYASFGQDRHKPIGPFGLKDFMDSIGITYRPKTWK